MNDFTYLILSAFAVLLTLTIHEYSHGYMAYKLGDSTASNLGRLTLNPLKHLDPIGALCMIFFNIGWAKPVPVNMRNLRNPRRDFALVALAGPTSNLITAFFSIFAYLLIIKLLSPISFSNEFLFLAASNTLKFFQIFFSVNIGIAVFNLIPLPPLDGSRIAGLILPPKTYYKIMQHERIIMYVFLGWLLIGDAVARVLLSIDAIASSSVLSLIVRIISLSDILGYAIDGIATLMIRFWQLIPFLK